MTNAAELSSMSATVEELTRRLRSIAESYEASHREDLVSEVHEIERSLEGAGRRILRLVAAEGA